MGRSLLPSVSAHQAQHFAVSHPSRLPPCQLESWRHLPVASDEIPWRRAPALGEAMGAAAPGRRREMLLPWRLFPDKNPLVFWGEM